MTSTMRNLLGSFMRVYARPNVPATLVFATPAGEMDLELRIAISVRQLDHSPKLISPLKLASRWSVLRRAIEAWHAAGCPEVPKRG